MAFGPSRVRQTGPSFSGHVPLTLSTRVFERTFVDIYAFVRPKNVRGVCTFFFTFTVGSRRMVLRGAPGGFLCTTAAVAGTVISNFRHVFSRFYDGMIFGFVPRCIIGNFNVRGCCDNARKSPNRDQSIMDYPKTSRSPVSIVDRGPSGRVRCSTTMER